MKKTKHFISLERKITKISRLRKRSRVKLSRRLRHVQAVERSLLASLFTCFLINIPLFSAKASSSLVTGEILGSLGTIFKEKLQPIHALFHFEYLNQRRTKTIRYIGLKFLGTVNTVMPFQYLAIIP